MLLVHDLNAVYAKYLYLNMDPFQEISTKKVPVFDPSVFLKCITKLFKFKKMAKNLMKIKENWSLVLKKKVE